MAQEMGMFTVAQTIGSVLCCKCGILMQPNAANMCAKCIRSEFDITKCLSKSVNIVHCPECDRYKQPPSTWIKAKPESKDLLAFCLNRLKDLNKVRLVHAEFIWTEPHSKRIKVKLTVQKEVLNGTTFFYLEQLILKHDAAKYAIRIAQTKQGIDFFFNKQSHGRKFVEFLREVAPIRDDEGKKLVSSDTKSNTHVFKYSFSVEISPICREDLICLPPEVAISLGNFGPLVICNKVTSILTLLDPFTLRQSFLTKEQYWRSSFRALLSCKQLVEYIVLDVEVVSREVNVRGVRYVLADAQVARVSDFGKNDMIFSVRTHLGRILKAGDYALGYDLYGANINDIELDKYKGLVLPDVILIKKSYEKEGQKWGKSCSWKLKSLNMEINNGAKGGDHEENLECELFLRDLAENPGSVFNLSLYSNGEISEMGSMSNIEDVSLTLVDDFEDLDLGDDVMKE
ncbi:hypothetical protein DH2020_011508 [Rehmannia glutinosa]|uniref:60S ribosomal export protein NMD3 n=1 Tax=Rehmannia glutinosa TaxID=99300 RepID=A0ABR0XDI7_REHGL